MKKFTAVLSIVLFVLCFAIRSQASDLLGGVIQYVTVAPNTVAATFKGFYDCRGGTPPPSVQFSLRSLGCGSIKTYSGNIQGSTFQSINPYCTSTGNACNSSSLINIREVYYATTFIANAPQAQCTDWLLSVRECPRSSVANIQNAANSCLYVEAYINLKFPSNSPNSPEFLPPATLFVTVNSPATISNFAQVVWDADSLAYALKPAQDDYNSPLTYTSNLSYTNPIPSSSGIQLNPNTGMLTFTPNVYVQSSDPLANAYTVVVEAVMYQKINGVMTKISSTERIIPIFVVNNAPNVNPEIINATANGQPVQPNAIIQVQSGSTFNFQFGTADANPGDSVTILKPKSTIGNFTFTSSGGTRPTGTINWNVTGFDGQVIYFPIIVRDNACPVRGVTTQIFGVKVLANPLGIKKQVDINPNFIAYPNPFTNDLSFKLTLKNTAQAILIYNALGQEVDRISLAGKNMGEQSIRWENASRFAAGTYVAKLVNQGNTVQTLKFSKLQ